MKTLDPRYVVPSRTHFNDVIIPDLYDTTRKAIENDLAQTQHLALTTDSLYIIYRLYIILYIYIYILYYTVRVVKIKRLLT